MTFEEEMDRLISFDFINLHQRDIAKSFIEDMIVRQVAKRIGFRDGSIDEFHELDYKLKIQTEERHRADQEIAKYKDKYEALNTDFNNKVINTSKSLIRDTLMEHLKTDGDIHRDCDY